MEGSSKVGLESLYHETNRSISDTHAALAQLNNYSNYGGGDYGSTQQNKGLQARKIEGSINTINRYALFHRHISNNRYCKFLCKMNHM